MADYLPQNNGNWSTTTWITAFSNLTAFAGGNTPPTIIDDVYADGKTIYIDINTGVRSIRTTTTPRTGGLAGGVFTANHNITLTSNVIGGTTTCLQFVSASPNFFTLIGNLSTNNPTGNNTRSVLNNSSGTIYISGNVLGCTYNLANAGQVSILDNRSTGNIFLTGNVVGYNGVECSSVVNFDNGTITIYGNLSSAVANNSNFVVNNGTTGTVGGSTGVVTIYGNLFSTGTLANVANRCAGSTTIFGNLEGPGVGASNTHIGTFNIIGNVLGGSTTSRIPITNSSTGVVNITGNVVGGSGNDVYAMDNTGLGTINVYGNVTGGAGGASSGGRNLSVGTINVFGNVTAGTNTNAFGIQNTSTGVLYATRVVGNDFGLGSTGIASVPSLVNTQNGKAYVEQIEFGPRGATPISGPVYILPSNRNTLTGRLTALGNTVTFYNSLSVSGLLPPVSSVRLGTVYNVGNSTGAMAVPSASAVQFGVPVDNTVGTAALTPQSVWGYSRLSATEVNSMGDRLRNTATTQSVGYQIASFNL